MTFPILNEFIPVFLEALTQQSRCTRQYIIDFAVKTLKLTEQQQQLKTKNNILLVTHRLGLCDGMLNKAGLIEKEKSDDSNLNDIFWLTSRGRYEVRNNLDDITVQYLQTFYDGKVLKGSGAEDTNSNGEFELAKRLEGLSVDFTVFHSVRWNAHTSQRGSVGEADFVIAHPQNGLLVLEVKGGRISFKREGVRQKWYSEDYYGNIHEIKDPISQAERNRRNLHAWLVNDRRTRNHSYAIFHAVAFPDTRVTDDIRPDCPKDIVIDAERMIEIETTLVDIFAYWELRADVKNQNMGGQRAVDALVELFIPQKTLSQDVGSIFERERRKIEALTRRQFNILQTLQSFRQAVIVGGAGTGKTMIAMEKASQLATAGFRVLFLTYNRPINDWIRDQLSDDLIYVMTFHAYARWMLNQAKMSISNT